MKQKKTRGAGPKAHRLISRGVLRRRYRNPAVGLAKARLTNFRKRPKTRKVEQARQKKKKRGSGEIPTRENCFRTQKGLTQLADFLFVCWGEEVRSDFKLGKWEAPGWTHKEISTLNVNAQHPTSN